MTTVDIDLEGWPRSEARFDFVIAVATFAAAENVTRMLERLGALLAPGAALVVGIPEGENGMAARRALAEQFAAVRYAVWGTERNGRLVAVAFSDADDYTQRWLDLFDQQRQLLAELDGELAHARALLQSEQRSRGLRKLLRR